MGGHLHAAADRSGFLLAAPASGFLSDRFGARWFSTGGMVLTAVSFVLLEALPIDFNYWAFAAVLLVSGIGMGLFTSPNRAEIMNSLPADSRGAGAGMNATFQNAAMVLSIGVFFSLMIAGLSQNLPSVMEQGLAAHGVPAADAARVAGLPPVGVLFAAFLGYNPIQQLLGPILSGLPADQATFLTGRSFFPHADLRPVRRRSDGRLLVRHGRVRSSPLSPRGSPPVAPGPRRASRWASSSPRAGATACPSW